MDKNEALKLALEALTATMSTHGFQKHIDQAKDDAIAAIKQALIYASHLAAPVQKPDAMGCKCAECGAWQRWTPSGMVCKNGHGGVGGINQRLYTTPPAAQPAPVQEPFAWCVDSENSADWAIAKTKEGAEVNAKLMDAECIKTAPFPLYTTPPAAQPAVPLTDEQIHKLDPLPHRMYDRQRIDFARAIEAAHGIKENTSPMQEPVGVCGNPRNACGLPCEPCEGKPDPEWIAPPAAQHWHDLYKAKCQELHDERARLGAQVEALAAPVQHSGLEMVNDEGENRAVRMFLALYGGACGVTAEQMRKHLDMAGFDGAWPEWANNHNGHLTKAGAQLWIRHLFALEVAPPTAQRQWVGLTDEEMYLNCPNWLSQEQCKVWVQQIEAKLREKNT